MNNQQCVSSKENSLTEYMEPEPLEGTLSEAERRRARTKVAKKAISYFEDRNHRSCSQDSLFTRRRNLATHLGVDESVCKSEVQSINVHALPIPASAIHESQESLVSGSYRYIFRLEYNRILIIIRVYSNK